jgi:hypothetical protein
MKPRLSFTEERCVIAISSALQHGSRITGIEFNLRPTRQVRRSSYRDYTEHDLRMAVHSSMGRQQIKERATDAKTPPPCATFSFATHNHTYIRNLSLKPIQS